jgi:hypothetical protein
MSKPQLALNPKHPERICWGCDRYCSAHELRCGNGTIRTQHPVELFGEGWLQWQLNGDTSALAQDVQVTPAGLSCHKSPSLRLTAPKISPAD